MNLLDLLYNLDIDVEALSEEDQEKLEMKLSVHFQPNYPLKASVENVRIHEDEIQVAISDGEGYGDREVWDSDY